MKKHPTDRRIRETEVTALLAKPARAPQGCSDSGHPFLARLTQPCLSRLKALTVGASYAQGTVLFAEGQRADGVYVILEGRAKLSVCSSRGKSLILGFFGPGTVLGLEGAILGWPYVVTAEIVEPTKATFMSRDDLLRYLRDNEKAGLEAAEMASETCYFLSSRIKAIELSQSAKEKLARFILGLCSNGAGPKGETRLKLDLSQEAIAQMIGVSRETVTRLFSHLKKRNILDWRRSVLVIRDRAALQKLAES
jgi:CRP-like cAMP-binding protein